MDDFEYRKQIPQYWLNKSSDLRASAGVIWYCIHSEQSASIAQELNFGEGFSLEVATSPTFPMLCGLSLELMYKAICVIKKTDFVKIHFLLKLAGLAGVNLTKQDEGLLEILTESVIWDGKYPVPLDKNKVAFENLPKLYRKHLFDEVNVSEKFKVYRPNHALNWDSFNALWSEGFRVYKEARSTTGLV